MVTFRRTIHDVTANYRNEYILADRSEVALWGAPSYKIWP